MSTNTSNNSLSDSISLNNIKRLKRSATIPISPHKQFYKIFREDEIVEIISDLKFKRQIKLKYNYFADGAAGWNDFYFESPITQIINSLKNLILDNLLYFVQNSQLVNIVDVGPGNGYPVKDWLQKLNDLKILYSYICVDISQDINNLVEKNMQAWFPGMPVYKHQADIEQTDIAKYLIQSKLHNSVESSHISNIILLLGNTFCNFIDRVEVLKNLTRSMDINDLLVISYTNDIDLNKVIHNYIASKTAHRHVGWIAKMLGFNYGDKYLTTTYDSRLNARVKNLNLTKDYLLKFKLFNHDIEIRFNKGESINLWRHYLISEELLRKEFDEVGLELVFKQYDMKKSIAIVACRIKDAFNQRKF
jgi:uncharacterized SAM-dependent methyltransferase